MRTDNKRITIPLVPALKIGSIPSIHNTEATPLLMAKIGAMTKRAMIQTRILKILINIIPRMFVMLLIRNTKKEINSTIGLLK